MPYYHLFLNKNDRIVISAEILFLEDDDAALKIAREAVTDVTGSEVWEGERLVGSFEAISDHPDSHEG